MTAISKRIAQNKTSETQSIESTGIFANTVRTCPVCSGSMTGYRTNVKTHPGSCKRTWDKRLREEKQRKTNSEAEALRLRLKKIKDAETERQRSLFVEWVKDNEIRIIKIAELLSPGFTLSSKFIMEGLRHYKHFMVKQHIPNSWSPWLGQWMEQEGLISKKEPKRSENGHE